MNWTERTRLFGSLFNRQTDGKERGRRSLIGARCVCGVSTQTHTRPSPPQTPTPFPPPTPTAHAPSTHPHTHPSNTTHTRTHAHTPNTHTTHPSRTLHPVGVDPLQRALHRGDRGRLHLHQPLLRLPHPALPEEGAEVVRPVFLWGGGKRDSHTHIDDMSTVSLPLSSPPHRTHPPSASLSLPHRAVSTARWAGTCSFPAPTTKATSACSSSINRARSWAKKPASSGWFGRVGKARRG